MHVHCLPEQIIKALRALYASGIWHDALPGTGSVAIVFVVDVSSRILLFIHHLLSISSRLGTLSGALQTVETERRRGEGAGRGGRGRETDNYSGVGRAMKHMLRDSGDGSDAGFFLPRSSLYMSSAFQSLILGSLPETELCL